MSAAKRVAVVAFSAPPHSSGGVASAHFNLYQALQDVGMDVRLFTFGDTAQPQSETDIVRSGSPRWWMTLLRIINRWLFRFLQPGKRAYQSLDILAAQWGARRMARKLRQWDPDVIILSDHGAPGLALRKDRANLLLVSHHNPARFLESPAPPNYSKLDARQALRWEQRVVDKVDAVVAPSQYMLDFFQRTYDYSGELQRIPNLLNPEVLQVKPGLDVRQIMGLEDKAILIYMPSAGSYLKGAEYAHKLINQAQERWGKQIAFYVPGAIESKYSEVFAQLERAGRVHLPGPLSYAKNMALAKQCDYCVSLSLMENYSMALLEAALLGLPILAFETGGNADIVREGKNGFLFALGELTGMLKKIEGWQDRKVLERFRQKALDFSRQALDPAIAQADYVELVNSL